MKHLLRKSLLIAALGFGMSVANIASAGAPDDGEEPPPPPPPEPGDCSPGFYKNHIDYWWGIYCDIGSGECSNLLTALICKGADATCGRSTAAAFLNSQSGCKED
jgi:hypothetical protein